MTEDILIITGRNKHSIENHFDKSLELERTLQNTGKCLDLKEIIQITDIVDVCYANKRNNWDWVM